MEFQLSSVFNCQRGSVCMATNHDILTNACLIIEREMGTNGYPNSSEIGLGVQGCVPVFCLLNANPILQTLRNTEQRSLRFLAFGLDHLIELN